MFLVLLDRSFEELRTPRRNYQATLLRKASVTIAGETRNNIIGTFRDWRGAQYIPQNVHASIQMVERSPWLESEVLSLDERLEMLEKQRLKKKLDKKGEKESGFSTVPVMKPPHMES